MDLGQALTLGKAWWHAGPRAWKESNMVLGKCRAERLVWMVGAMWGRSGERPRERPLNLD